MNHVKAEEHGNLQARFLDRHALNRVHILRAAHVQERAQLPFPHEL
jgi:hypothetical protein